MKICEDHTERYPSFTKISWENTVGFIDLTHIDAGTLSLASLLFGIAITYHVLDENICLTTGQNQFTSFY